MIQIDLLLSYGFSSGIALAARKNLEKEKSLWTNKYFMTTLLWLSLAFAPQVVYLIWRFPAWESMFVVTEYSDYPAWFASVISIGIIVLGISGFYITSRLLKGGNLIAGGAQMVGSGGAALLLVTVGWDGTGLDRLLYAGSGADWANGVVYSYADFLTSPVSLTLTWLEALVMIPYVVLLIAWIRESRRMSAET